jgi:hypothetical protein
VVVPKRMEFRLSVAWDGVMGNLTGLLRSHPLRPADS